MKAIITGATSGIGKAIALKLAKEGYDLAICARNNEALEQTKEELLKFGNSVFVFQADCSIKEQVVAFSKFVQKKWKQVDVLVNNAGAYLPGKVLEEADENFETMLSLNLNAPYYLSKIFGKMMEFQKSGHIFNICSIASISPPENGGSYSVTKSALLCLNNVMRQELEVHGIKVTAILPGATITSSWKDIGINEEKFVQPSDIANVVFNALSLSTAANIEQIIINPVNF